MNYLNDVLTFLGLERGSCITVYARSDFIKNILICVPKMNEGLTGDMRVNYPFKR